MSNISKKTPFLLLALDCNEPGVYIVHVCSVLGVWLAINVRRVRESVLIREDASPFVHRELDLSLSSRAACRLEGRRRKRVSVHMASIHSERWAILQPDQSHV